MWPVSNARNTCPPDKFPELPSDIAARVRGAKLFRGSTCSATWQYVPYLRRRSSACKRRSVIISPGEYNFGPPLLGNPLTNFTTCRTIRTTIMPGTRSNGTLWRRDLIFSFRNLMFRSIKPQCCEAAAQSNLGMVGRPTTKSLMEENSWSPITTTIRKPRKRYILYVARNATQMSSLFLLVRWVIVVKHILVLMVVKKVCLLTKKQSIANSTFW